MTCLAMYAKICSVVFVHSLAIGTCAGSYAFTKILKGTLLVGFPKQKILLLKAYLKNLGSCLNS